MQETTAVRFVNGVNNWYSSRKSMIFFMTVTTLFGIFQFTVYACGVNVNGHNISEGSFLPWFAMAMAIAGCYCGFIGGILVFRGKHSFIYFQVGQMLISFINSILSGLLLLSFAFLWSLVFTFLRRYMWPRGYLEKWNLTKENKAYILFGVLITSLVITFTLEAFYGSTMNVFTGTDIVKAKWTWYFDAINASITIAASTMMFFRWRWCYVLFFIGKFFAISNYAYAGMYVPIVQMVLFSIMDVTGFFAWSFHLMEK